MSFPNERITSLINDIYNFRLQVEKRSDPQIWDGLRNVPMRFLQTLIKPPKGKYKNFYCVFCKANGHTTQTLM